MRQQMLDPSVRFSCRGCTACCDQPWQTLIEADKAHAIEQHDFSAYPQLRGRTLFHPKEDSVRNQYVVAKGEGNRCIFLADDGLCIIHKELGAEAKPGMCRQFPFLPARTWTEDRVSVNYGCPSVQNRAGRCLADQADEIAAVTPVSNLPVSGSAATALDAQQALARDEADAFFDRAARLFDTDRPGDIWSAFAELLALAVAVRAYRRNSVGGERESLTERLRSDDPLPDAPEAPEVAPYASPAEAPLVVRFLFAATLFPDTLPVDSTANLGFLRRLTLVPRLMALSRLSGTYASRLLGRNVAIGRVLDTPVENRLESEATALLKRYYRSRLWQRFPAGTRMPILAGIHQHILDLNAILFYARALAMGEPAGRLTADHVARALTLVEFHLSNQTRLHEHTLKGWLRVQLEDPAAAFASLRLMAFRRSARSAASRP